jgi:ADP-L-glycero-D-manno-heptose 6-epimerase
MKVILTGGAGFIGSCLLWKLNDSGIDDIIVVDSLDNRAKKHNLKNKSYQEYIDKDKFIDAIGKNKFKKADLIIHMGACTSTTESDASYLIENNYLYSKTLAQWAFGRRIPFLYASSAATYGDGKLGYSDEDKVTLKLSPLNMYGYSKHAFDLWLLKNKLINKATGFKFFNVFGPNEYHKGDMKSLIARAFDTVAKGEPMRLFKSCKKEYADGEQERDFIYVKDAVDIVYYFVEHPDSHGIFNVGTGRAHSWNEIAYALFAALDKKPRIEYIDMPQELRPRYQYFTQAKMEKAKKAGLRHAFMSLKDAVKDYCGYLKAHSYL